MSGLRRRLATGAAVLAWVGLCGAGCKGETTPRTFAACDEPVVTFVLRTEAPDGSTACARAEGGPGLVSIRTAAEGRHLDTSGGCVRSCESCEPDPACSVGGGQAHPSPPGPMISPGPQGLRYRWTGQHFERGVCGDEGSCVERHLCTWPGRYVARFCAELGEMQDGECPDFPDSRTCTEVEFEYPIDETVEAVLTLPGPGSGLGSAQDAEEEPSQGDDGASPAEGEGEGEVSEEEGNRPSDDVAGEGEGEGEGERGGDVVAAGRLAVEPEDWLGIYRELAEPEAVGALTLANVGVDALEVSELVLDEAGGDDTLSVGSDPQAEDACPGERPFRLAPDERCAMTVTYRPPRPLGQHTATLTIRSHGLDRPDVVVEILAATGFPALAVIPAGQIGFERVLVGETATWSVQLRNVGTAPLRFEGFAVTGDPGFAVEIAPDSPVALLPAMLAPQDAADTVELDVSVTPEADGELVGELTLTSSDLNSPRHTVRLAVLAVAPCVRVAPLEVDFRSVLVGEGAERHVDVEACGAVPVTITSVALAEGSHPAFRVNHVPEGLAEDCLADSADACVGEATLLAGAVRTLTIRYEPVDIRSCRSDPMGRHRRTRRRAVGGAATGAGRR